MKFSWFVAQRFRHSRRKSGFASFMSSSSTIGIGLGCAVLIVMLSVMNGFENALKTQLLSKIPHGEIRAISAQGMSRWEYQLSQFEQDPTVKLVQPFARVTALAQKGKQTKATEVTALDPAYAEKSDLVRSLPSDLWQRFKLQPNAIILGASIAEKLALSEGDRVQLLVPPMTDTQKLAKPVPVWMTYVGYISLGGELDQFTGFMHLSFAAEALKIDEGAQGLLLSYYDPFDAASKTREFAYQLQQAAYISDWTRTQGHLYQDIQLVRVVVYIALILVISVACFNVVSSLVMLINEKKPEIDMLLTMGALPNDIVAIFLIQGLSNSIKGMFIGSICGAIVAHYLSSIVAYIESLIGIKLLSSDVYFVDYLPSQLQIQDIVVTLIIALVIALIAVTYSSYKFARAPLSLR